MQESKQETGASETLAYQTIRDLTVLLCRERGNSVAQALLWEFGYKLADLPTSMWSEFASIARHLIAGGSSDYREVIREKIVQSAAEDLQERLLAALNAAMVHRDGPARPAPAVIAPAPLITTKPPIAGLTRVSAQDHRVGGWGFVR